MHIRVISHEEVQGFIDCYIEVFRSLKGILPDEYVNNQIKRASSTEFQENVSKEVSDPHHILLVSLDDGHTIGLAWGNIKEDGSSWLSFLGVVPAFRRKGIGRSLLTRFIEESNKKGSGIVSLDTDPGLIPAIKLYESMGFVKDGLVKNPYGLELILYRKDIT